MDLEKSGKGQVRANTKGPCPGDAVGGGVCEHGQGSSVSEIRIKQAEQWIIGGKS
jgi:hypothetical protein